MNIQRMSDRQLERDRKMFHAWIKLATPEEHNSGEVESWQNHLKLVDDEIERKQEQGEETR